VSVGARFKAQEAQMDFKTQLATEYGVVRSDVLLDSRVLWSSEQWAPRAMGVEQVLARLRLNNDGLIELLRTGRLPAPALVGQDVYWRQDEVEALVPLYEQFRGR
jgi:hypothetical protein